MSTIKAISISDRKGIQKKNIESTNLLVDSGLENDAHAGKWHRQVSFLAQESIDTMRDKGLDVVAGNFAENITTLGIELIKLPVGQHIKIGEAELVISQLGKICHTRCAIYHQAGDCVMPSEGIFGVVIQEGAIKVGDQIEILDRKSTSAAIIGTKETEETIGHELSENINDAFSPAFIRFDTLSDKEGGSLPAILEDLTATQKTENIIIFDPSGSHGLPLAGLAKHSTDDNCYLKNSSKIIHCRSLDDLKWSDS